MLYHPRHRGGLLIPSNTGRYANAYGTSVTPASGSKGSWTQIFASTSEEATWIEIVIHNNQTNNASRDTLLDVGIGGAGSEMVIIPDLVCGDADTFTTGAKIYRFPLRIPAGTRIAVRAASTVTTAFNVLINLLTRQPFGPTISKVSAVGVSTATAGTGLTPGTGSLSAWVSLGTTPHRAIWWQLGVQVNAADTSHVAAGVDLQLAFGDGTTKIPITQIAYSVSSSEKNVINQNRLAGWRDVPEGSTLYVRGQTSGASADPLNLVAYAGV